MAGLGIYRAHRRSGDGRPAAAFPGPADVGRRDRGEGISSMGSTSIWVGGRNTSPRPHLGAGPAPLSGGGTR
jgi:hypothetical protein